MLLSIIVPIYKNEKELEKYINRLEKLEGTDFEVVFVVDTNNDESLKIIDENLDRIKAKVKIIFNSKRTGRSNAIATGVESAVGDYVMTHTPSYSYKEELVTVLLKEAEKTNADIIEFKPKFSSPIRWNPNLRKKYMKAKSIETNPEILAYIYFFSFNKIFKRSLYREIKFIPTLSQVSNRHSIELLCKLFLAAKTYSNISRSLVRARNYIPKVYNPLIVLKEFELITSSDIYKQYKSEFEYNKFFTETVAFLGFFGGVGNKVALKKYQSKIKKTYEKTDFFALNKYYLQNSNEAKLLGEYKNDYSTKAYKAFSGK